jgi:hypothetical protein
MFFNLNGDKVGPPRGVAGTSSYDEIMWFHSLRKYAV